MLRIQNSFFQNIVSFEDFTVKVLFIGKYNAIGTEKDVQDKDT